MQVLYSLSFGKETCSKVEFGIPETQQEREAMFRFRYNVYLKKGYIQPNSSELDYDEFDKSGQCIWFVARCGDDIIGTFRLIQTASLPIERYFAFSTPTFRGKPAPLQSEVGRLVVSHDFAHRKCELPGALVSLFLIKCAGDSLFQHGLDIAYAFIKAKLHKKMRSRKMPIHYIAEYKQTCPQSDLLFDYFNNPNDRVIPVYFSASDFSRYYQWIINPVFFSISKGKHLRLRPNWLTRLVFKCGKRPQQLPTGLLPEPARSGGAAQMSRLSSFPYVPG